MLFRSGTRRTWDLDEVKRLLAQVGALVGERPRYGTLADATILHPGVSAAIHGDRMAGLVGELHPGVTWWRPEPRIYLAEVAVAGLRSGDVEIAQVSVPPTTPPISRDIALLVPAGVSVGEVVELARTSLGRATTIEVFDLFAGPPLAPGERSVGLRFTFQPDSAGADDGDIADEIVAFEGAAQRAFGARPRGVGGA